MWKEKNFNFLSNSWKKNRKIQKSQTNYAWV